MTKHSLKQKSKVPNNEVYIEEHTDPILPENVELPLTPQQECLEAMEDLDDETDENASHWWPRTDKGELSLKAQKLWEADHSGGEYVYRELTQAEMYVSVRSKSLVDNTPSSQGYRNINLNRNAMFMFVGDQGSISEVKDYRARAQTIELSYLITSEDDLKNNQCCRRISMISNKQWKAKVVVSADGTEEQKVMRCFIVQGEDSIWRICNESLELLQQFKFTLTLHVLHYGNRYLRNPIQLTESYQHYSWTYNSQSSWGGLCNIGKSQSPIALSQESAVTKSMSINFNFNNETQTDSVVRWTGNDIEVVGDFGYISFAPDLESSVSEMPGLRFNAHKLQFKVQPEHKINLSKSEHEYVGEIVVHVKGLDGSTGLLSFMIRLEEDEESEVRNPLIDQLNPDTWEQVTGWQSKNLEKLNLDLLYVQNTQQYMPKNMFFYMGSKSAPPCQEGVYRWVLTEPITMNHNQFYALRDNSFKRDTEQNGNVRSLQAVGLRSVYYSIDTYTKCKDLYNNPYNLNKETKMSPDEALNAQIKAEGGVISKVANKISATSHVNSENTLTGKIGNIETEAVDTSNLSQAEIDNLLKGKIVDDEEKAEAEAQKAAAEQTQAEAEKPEAEGKARRHRRSRRRYKK